MAIEEALFSIITGDADVTALIGTRCYPDHLPQDPTLPAVVYELVDDERPNAHDGPQGLVRARFQLNCWAASNTAARALADDIRLALDGYSGTSASVEIRWANLVNQRDGFDFEVSSNNWPGIHRRIQDYQVYYREALS